MKRLFWLSLLVACNNTPPEAAPPKADAAPAASASASAVVDAGPDKATVLAHGKELYGKYCAFCHGDSGEGYKADNAPALAHEDFLAIASDAYLRKTITKGRPGTTMSPWSRDSGGPLYANDAAAIAAYIRDWQKKGIAPADEADAGTTTGDATAGLKLYAANCERCHGKDGHNGKYNALANPELLAAADDSFLRTSIALGRTGTPMIGFAKPLGETGLDDVVALLRSWKRPPDPQADLPPQPGALQAVVFHPAGPPPALDAAAEYIPVDTVKKAYDAGAAMVIIDARPPADYARMHIAGAISVPFYMADQYAKQLPKSAFILTYCGCPHAESGQVRAALKKLEYPKVAVIDEGLFAWRDRGYPVRGGPKP